MMDKPAMPLRQGAGVVAAFDLDGTLTRRDTSLAFLAFAVGADRLMVRVALQGPGFLADLAEAIRREMGAGGRHGASRLGSVRGRWEGEAHQRAVRAALRGISRSRATMVGERFAREAMGSFLAPGAMDQFRWHRSQGHRTALVSSSLAVYLEPWGLEAGFDAVLATRLAFGSDGTFQGRFEGEPCWGPEKVRRLEEAMGPLRGATVVAYGNGRGDHALLQAADVPVLVGSTDAWTRIARDVRASSPW